MLPSRSTFTKYQVCHGVSRSLCQQEGQHPLTGQRATNFRLLANHEPNAGDHDFPLTGSNCGNLTAFI